MSNRFPWPSIVPKGWTYKVFMPAAFSGHTAIYGWLAWNENWGVLGLQVNKIGTASWPLGNAHVWIRVVLFKSLLPDHLLLDRSPNIGPLISRWELDKFKNCWNKSFSTSKILILLHQQFSNLLISQRDMSGPRLRALSNIIGDLGVPTGNAIGGL
jgi:hypothetical protein